jgi:hypothetical protein
LVYREATSRENKRLASELREAKLRQAAVVEDVNLHGPRDLDRALFQKLARLRVAARSRRLLPPVISAITITGIGDHLQPVWLITFAGMRTAAGASRLPIAAIAPAASSSCSPSAARAPTSPASVNAG